MEVSDTSNSTLAAAKVSTLSIESFHEAVKNYIDYNKPDPIVRRQLESWALKWSEGDGIASDDKEKATEMAKWSPEHCIKGELEIRGDFVTVTLGMECIWADGEAAKSDKNAEDGRLSFRCRIKSGNLIETKEDEEKAERKIRKRMMSRLRQDSFISQLWGNGKEKKEESDFVLANASIYLDAAKFEMEERVDVSQNAAEILRRSLWSSTTSTLDIVEVFLALPTLPCRSSDKVETTTRLANRAKLRLLEDAMLDECEKEGEDELIDDLKISNPKGTSEYENTQQASRDGPSQKKKKRSDR